MGEAKRRRVVTNFLLTWTEKGQGFPHENILDMITRFNKDGYVVEPWRFCSTKMLRKHARACNVPARVWLLEQRKGSKGIFGIGEVLGEARKDEASNGNRQWMVDVRFTTLVDPKREMLIGEDAATKVLGTGIRSSGVSIEEDKVKELDALLAARLGIQPRA